MEENKITKTLLYIGEEGEVSMDVIIDHVVKQCGRFKRLWQNCLM